MDALRLLEATRQALCAVDLTGRLTFVNRAAAALLGRPAAALVGEPVQALLAPESLAQLGPVGPGCAAVRFGQRREVMVVRGDGTRCAVAYVLDPLGEPGRPGGAVLQLEDVSERRRTEAALQETQRTLTTLMLNLPGMAYRCLNTPDWPMQFVSEGCLALTGYPPERLCGPDALPFNRLMYPDDVARVWGEVQAALAARAPYRLTYRIRTAAGEERWCWEQGCGVWDADGQLVALEGFISDITDRKQAEARLLLSDRMASVGTLAAGVAHEINNPLAFVQGNIDFLAQQLADATGAPLPPGELEEMRLALGEAREGTRRMRDIVRDLKTFSRVDDANQEWVDLEKVLTSAANITANEVRHRARLVRTHEPTPRVFGHEGRLVQVFVNLLVNAAHALPDGHAEQHEIHLRTGVTPDGRVRVEVQDSGCGIPRDVLPRLFEPFFTTKPVGQGTGLGLSICHGIVSALGGTIEVESEVGRGSCFRVLLPATAPERAQAPRPAAGPRPTLAPRGRILVVDDEAMVGAAIRRVLGRAHDVEVTTRADEALGRVAGGEHFDVILCDLMMPVVSGMDFHAALAERAPAAQARVVFLTGGAFSPQAREFLARVPNLRLDKPFEPDALLALVRTRLGAPA